MSISGCFSNVRRASKLLVVSNTVKRRSLTYLETSGLTYQWFPDSVALILDENDILMSEKYILDVISMKFEHAEGKIS